MLAHRNESQVQGEFVEWAIEKGYLLTDADLGDMLAEYHGIDLTKIEAEKRAMLKEIRA